MKTKPFPFSVGGEILSFLTLIIRLKYCFDVGFLNLVGGKKSKEIKPGLHMIQEYLEEVLKKSPFKINVIIKATFPPGHHFPLYWEAWKVAIFCE